MASSEFDSQGLVLGKEVRDSIQQQSDRRINSLDLAKHIEERVLLQDRAERLKGSNPNLSIGAPSTPGTPRWSDHSEDEPFVFHKLPDSLEIARNRGEGKSRDVMEGVSSQNSDKVKSMQSAYMQHGRRDSSAVALVPSSGTVNITKQSKEILFPYEDFVELFNWDNRGFPQCGLLNCGNSYFANVVLQCLVYTQPLIAYLLEKGHRKECRRNDWCFLCEFQTHVERSSESRHPFSPINILSRLPNIGGDLGYGKQEDGHEFMRSYYLLYS
ncbi:Ubiquitin carboxyl-terminal hydrolase 18 [Camellia lanceoleosa]|uniref:Ubiquitin carboxyl-terminal hydrolase 18 n=1 Tax=Camellia lanceoleosa TaxID=1840588 RepID=A0ACC0HRT0_9ERIC|nr:Ubiquitin carboxyl-terminal hydrolase 18 [Camellia lanceoleosa]